MTFVPNVFRRVVTVAVVAGIVVSSGLRITGQTPSGQGAALRIVIIAGEDAVNIIQQKTAVAPIVEVRDRNDLPIAGVPVTFTVGAGNASFAGGLQTLTVTTNAAGRAAVTSLNPVGNGAFQINVTAASQGQTATATISQTNFSTAAEAVQAGKSVSQPSQSGGGSSGAGTTVAPASGGLSTLALTGIIAGVAAGGVLAATALGGPEACTFSLSPSTSSLAGSGGTFTLNISVSPADCEPANWTATSSDPSVTFSPSSGTGNATITGTVAANNGTGQRTVSVTVGGQSISLTQAVACRFNLSSTNVGPLAGAGGTTTVNVTVEPSGCSPTQWTASSNTAFLSVSPASGSGNGTVTITASANPGTATRTGTVTVAGQTVNVSQNRVFPPCNSQQIAGGDVPETRTIELGRTSGTFVFTYYTSNIADQFFVIYEGRTLFDTGCVSTGLNSPSRTISYSGASSTVSIQVTPNCQRPGTGTLWEFSVSCPQ